MDLEKAKLLAYTDQGRMEKYLTSINLEYRQD